MDVVSVPSHWLTSFKVNWTRINLLFVVLFWIYYALQDSVVVFIIRVKVNGVFRGERFNCFMFMNLKMGSTSIALFCNTGQKLENQMNVLGNGRECSGFRFNTDLVKPMITSRNWWTKVRPGVHLVIGAPGTRNKVSQCPNYYNRRGLLLTSLQLLWSMVNINSTYTNTLSNPTSLSAPLLIHTICSVRSYLWRTCNT